MTVITKNQKVEFKLNGLLDCEILLTEKWNIRQQEACWRFSLIPVDSKKISDLMWQLLWYKLSEWTCKMSDNYYMVKLEIISGTKYATLRNQKICLPMENICWNPTTVGKKVVFWQQIGKIETRTRNIEPLVD